MNISVQQIRQYYEKTRQINRTHLEAQGVNDLVLMERKGRILLIIKFIFNINSEAIHEYVS